MLRRKRSDRGLKPPGLFPETQGPPSGGWSPANIPNTIGYWDARDIAVAGPVSSWSPRASDGSIGAMVGTGTHNGGAGAGAQILQPRYASAGVLAASGVATAGGLGMWFLGRVDSQGDSLNSRSLLTLGKASSQAGGYAGLLWYNFQPFTFKIHFGNVPGSATMPGFPNYVLERQSFLWIVNFLTDSSAIAYQYALDGTQIDGLSTTNFDPDARIQCGQRWASSTNTHIDGAVNAFGVAKTPFSNSDIASLRSWANREWGIIAQVA